MMAGRGIEPERIGLRPGPPRAKEIDDELEPYQL
jgi:hypothetical protein